MLKRGPEILKELEEALARESAPETVVDTDVPEEFIEQPELTEEPETPAVPEEIQETPKSEEYIDPVDVPLPVAPTPGDSFSVTMPGEGNNEDPSDDEAPAEEPAISDGFSVKRKFGDIKFGDDYDISSDDDYDEV